MSKKIKAKQTYCSAWELLPDFKGWLQAVPGNPSRAYCTVCKKSLYAHRLTLLKHMCTGKHTKEARIKFSKNVLHKTQNQETVNTKISTQDESPEVNTVETHDVNSSDGNNSGLQNLHLRPMPQGSKDMDEALKPNVLPPISTHVIDSARGTPVGSLHVSLFKLTDGVWTLISKCVTNPLGRCDEFISREVFKPGRFKLHFDVDRYFELRRQNSFYPYIEIVFDVRCPQEHYHVPLILSPFGYSTYRGS